MMRLSKVLRELNISLDRAIEFLSSKGVEIEVKPTSKIDSVAYDFLINEFRTDATKKSASSKIATELVKEREVINKFRLPNSNGARGIGFTNFRRFIDFPVLNFSPITYMVGKNNSGKSTIVKALLLVLDYLQFQLSDTFSFESNVLEDVNIVTFGRAKNNTTDNPVISYNYQLNEFDFNIEIIGDADSTTAKVKVFKVYDNNSGVTIEINHLKGEVFASRNVIEDTRILNEKNPIVTQLEKAVATLKKDLDKVEDKKSKKAFQLQSDYQKTLDKLKDARKLKTEVKSSNSNNYNVSHSLDSIFGEENQNDDNPLAYIFERFLYLNEINAKKNKKEIKNLADIITLNRSTTHLTNCIDRVISAIEKEQYFYIGANPSKQSALFYLRDKENALAQAIHRFYQLGIPNKAIYNNEELKFVQHWMYEFNVGTGLSIDFIAGEAYNVKVYEEIGDIENDISSQLADKGMGSLQVMTLILRIAAIIRERKKLKQKRKVFTILIEEPELNLHPNLQSKLTEFFHEVHLKYEFNFIVETHSEYMIRKTQVIVNQEKYDNKIDFDINPFKVYYFPRDKQDLPYEMIYREDGKFSNEFRPGFFDISSDLAFDIL